MTTETKASAVAATLQPDDIIRIAINARVLGVAEVNTGEDRVMTIRHQGRVYWLLVEADDMTIEPRVTDERVDEVLDILNGFVVHEYETVSDIVMGRAVHTPEIVSSDFNLENALDWALSQQDVKAAYRTGSGVFVVELDGATVLEWQPDEEQWALTVSDDAKAVRP